MINISTELMFYRIIFIAFLSSVPATSWGQSNLVLKEISFHFEYKDVSGTIGDFHSASEVNLEDVSRSILKGSVSVSSLKTGNFLRDWALKGRKYFNENEYPRIHFESTEIVKTDGGISAKGLLTIKGKTNPWLIIFQETGKGLRGKAELYTSDFGISIKKKREENKVLITLDFDLE